MQAMVLSSNLRDVIREQFKKMSPAEWKERLKDPKFVLSLPLSKKEMEAVSRSMSIVEPQNKVQALFWV